MMTVESLLDAIFAARRLEQLQAEVRDLMIKQLLLESDPTKISTTEVISNQEFPGS